MSISASSHLDTFASDRLPSAATWPTLEFTIPELQYPERLNAAAELLDRTIDRFGGDRPAFYEADGSSWSYADVLGRANQFARVLVEDYGIVPGNRVLLRMPNSPWAAACWLGALKAGAVVCTTMTAWKTQELDAIIERINADLAIVDVDHFDAVADTFQARLGNARVILSGDEQSPLAAACDRKPTDFTAVDTAADDVALLAATSGTTGRPKITMHVHRDILAIADTFAAQVLHLTEDDISASTAPLAFTFGLGGLIVFPLRTGSASLLIDRLTPLRAAELIEPLGVTVLYTAPTGYRTLIKEGHADALRSLRAGVSAGEHLSRDVFEAVREATGLKLIDGIGSTEMLHIFISASGDDIRPGATGKPIPGYRATILGSDGEELPAGEPGRLAVIGPVGCRYLDDPRQEAYVVGGWNVTGDIYVKDDEGYFTYQSRADSLIVTAGYNVGAPEVEEVIVSHPDVAECAVVGRPDPERGMIVSAYVVPRAGVQPTPELTESILDTVKAKLAIYKCPRRVDFRTELPRNPSGKVQHFVLREEAAREMEASRHVNTETPISLP